MTNQHVEEKKKILFVDDEQSILDGLRNRLRRKRDRWTMYFAAGGKQALELLAVEPCDVIVTDMRMPGMDGAKLLQEVQVLYPNIVRIVLSGHAEFEVALRAVPVAHQFLSKPCDAGVLENVVDRAFQLQRLVGAPAIRSLVGKVSGLPSLPQLYSTLRSMLTDNTCTMESIAQVIKQDAGMSAKILQLVNSAFFRLSRPLSRIDEAINYLGLDAIHRMVLASELFDSSLVPRDFAPVLRALQKHSLEAATIAAQLLPEKKQQEDAFVSTLLHDIGKLLMVVYLPDQYTATVDLARRKNITLTAAEVELTGISHAEVGAYLLGIWGLPYFIVEAVANHHAPGRVDSGEFGILGAVHVGNALAHAIVDGTEEALDLAYVERVGILGQWPQWKTQFREQIETLDIRLTAG